MQAYNYYSTFNDPRWMRIAVAFALLLDTVQTGICSSHQPVPMDCFIVRFSIAGVMCYMQWEFTITNFCELTVAFFHFHPLPTTLLYASACECTQGTRIYSGCSTICPIHRSCSCPPGLRIPFFLI